MENPNCLIKIDIDKIFYKSNFFLSWAKKSKNLKTKNKLVKKGLKEMNNINYEEVRRNCKIEIKRCTID